MKILNILALIIALFIYSCGESGEENNIVVEDSLSQTEENTSTTKTESRAADMMAGESIYNDLCLVCHMENGQGIEGTFPPLAKSDFLLADKHRAAKVVMFGSKEPIKVNGLEYPGSMMTINELTDEQVKSVVNFILNSWGNKGGFVTLDEVKAIRADNE